MAIRNIVFDFGGVLVDWNPRYFYRDLFRTEEEMEWFMANVCNDEWNAELDRGRTFAEGIAARKAEMPEYSAMIELYWEGWPKMLDAEIADSVEVLKSLAGRYGLYGLTNWSAETFPIARARHSFFDLFDGIIVSGEVRLIKPDKAIFRLLLDTFGLKADECVYIDDNLKNVSAAAELGFNAIHFTTPASLRHELTALGVGM